MISFEDVGTICQLARNDMKEALTIMEFSYQSNTMIYYQRDTPESDEMILTVGIDQTFFLHFDLEGNFKGAHASFGNWPMNEEFSKSIFEPSNGNFKIFMEKMLDSYNKYISKSLEKKREWAIRRLYPEDNGKMEAPK